MMQARRTRKPSAPDTAASGDAETIVVFYRSPDVEQHVAALRPASGLQLELVRKGTLFTIPSDVAGVLWELSLEDGAQRLAPGLIGSVPAASYSPVDQPGLTELSRNLGFTEHLEPPLVLEDVERALGLREGVDLADRLDASAPRLIQSAASPDVVSDVVRAVNASTDPADVAAALTRRVGQLLPLPVWRVLAIEPDGELGWPGQPETDAAVRSAIESVAAVIAATGQPVVRITNFVDDRVSGAGAKVPAEGSTIGWPLVAGGRVVGVLVGLDSGRSNRLPNVPLAMSDALARLVEPAAFALANAQRVTRAEALSVTDDLTQLYNARYLHEALRREAKRATRAGWPLSLLFIDLDGFKEVNDRHGHLLGSRALVEAADIIRGCARETDVVARFGGDEFAMILPETDGPGALAVARRVLDRIGRFAFLALEGHTDRLTASIGLATLPTVADTVEGLLQAADAAMYRVKSSGRNGIHVASPDRPPLSGVPKGEQEIR
ncbi:MAG TPA: GGDEF domain-containing protein [Vicinamibacterales bacterium]|nr:GGDEF domain-containing protein [Vicinamibacterales bacterium]